MQRYTLSEDAQKYVLSFTLSRENLCGCDLAVCELAAAPDECQEDEEVLELLDDRPIKVCEGLYIGSYMAEMNKPHLQKAGITDILQVAQGLFPHHPMLFNYMNIQVQDIPSEDLVTYFPKCFEFIDRAIGGGGRALVHCAAGVSRSATIVLGYLMSRHEMNLAAAVDHLKAVRPWVCPNAGFLKQLEQRSSSGGNAELFVYSLVVTLYGAALFTCPCRFLLAVLQDQSGQA
eukprot:gene13603-13728_t